MLRSAGTALAGTVVLAALAGCASQASFGLPDLAPRGASPGAQVYTGYGYGYGVGYPGVYRPSYGYGAGYPGVYWPSYGYGYGYANPYYAAQGPYPYGYGYPYNPFPRYIVVPCADSNRDGHCDTQPPKRHHDNDGDDHPAQPHHGDVPRVRDGDGLDVAPTAHRRVVPAPAPASQQPAQVRPEPRRATPPEAASQRGPRVGSGRPSTTGNDVVSSRPTQEP
jgi:hypothetical protein